ncbi:MAG: methyltransferase domain-containing protein [Spirochaetaceae bacterium]|nr:methyltransferase domain-containing protein [Spirochaetaceae bacterium]
MKEYIKNNAKAWDFESSNNNFWTVSASKKSIENAKNGNIEVYLTPMKFVKKSWISQIKGKKILALACGGGQQSIIFSAAGADVTVLDISKNQIDNDIKVANENRLKLKTLVGDMQDLSMFKDNTFDMIYNPTSTCFIDDLQTTYNECYRVLKVGGTLLTSATNPALYLFDEKKELKGTLKIKYTIPYSDIKSLSEKKITKMIEKHDTFEFSHTWDVLLGGLFKAGFIVEDMYSDYSGFEIVDSFIHDCYFALRAKKIQ